MRGRRVLVAGGTGLIGTALVRRLVALGADVVGTSHTRPPALHPDRYRCCDLRDPAHCLAATAGMDDVILCAGPSVGAGGMRDDPASLVGPTLAIGAGMLDACRRNRVARTVLVSSSTVYAAAEHPLREDDLDLNVQPFALYRGIGWAKRALEQIAGFYRERYGLAVAVVRPTSVYGPHDAFDERANVLPALIRRAVAREDPFVVWGTGTAVRDFLYVEDLVDDLLLALERGSDAGPINLGSGTATSIREAVGLVLDVCGHRVEPRWDAAAPDAVPYRVLDVQRAERVLGPRRRTPLRTGLQATVAWYAQRAASRAA